MVKLNPALILNFSILNQRLSSRHSFVLMRQDGPMDGSPGDVGEAKPEGLENELDVGEASVGLANEALLILQPFQHHFTYVTDI